MGGPVATERSPGHRSLHRGTLRGDLAGRAGRYRRRRRRRQGGAAGLDGHPGRGADRAGRETDRGLQVARRGSGPGDDLRDGRADRHGPHPAGRRRHRPPQEFRPRRQGLPVRPAAGRSRPQRPHHLRGGGRRRPDHPVELADEPGHAQGRRRRHRRLHHGAETLRGKPAERHGLCRDDRRGRLSRRGLQPCKRRRRGRGQPAFRPQGRGHGQLHRLHPGRHRDLQERRRHPEKGAPGTGRQGRQRGLCRCRRQGGQARRDAHDEQHRPVVQRAQPDAGAIRDL